VFKNLFFEQAAKLLFGLKFGISVGAIIANIDSVILDQTTLICGLD